MSPDPLRGVSRRSTIRFLLLAAPPLVWLGFLVVAAAGFGPAGSIDAATRGGEIAAWFSGWLRQARVAAFAPDAVRGGEARTAAQRLEGVALLDPEGTVVEWYDAPAQPPPRFTDADTPDWRVREDGANTRLFLRSGPDEDGLISAASLVLDSRVGVHSFERLIPPGLRRGVQLAARFRDPLVRAKDPEATPPPATGSIVELRSPDDDPLGSLTVAAIPRPLRQARLRATGLACAALLLAILVAFLFDWGAVSSRPRGLLLTLLCIAALRWILARTAACGTLLPRGLGTASLFGSTRVWGLLASPADLLLTASALYLAALALRRFLVRRERGARALWLIGALAAVAATAGMLVSVSHNSRTALLDRPGLLQWGGSTLLTVGLLLAMLAAAELLGAGWTLLRGRAAPRRPPRLPVALAFLCLAAGASLVMQRLDERRAGERLRTTLAPQILGQSSRRRLALYEAVHRAHESLLARGLSTEGATPESLAYRFWSSSELFHDGLKSSLDIYDPGGRLISHFGFDLPQLVESVQLPEDGRASIVETSEVFALSSAASRSLLHAEMPIFRDGKPLAIVVGHVLDEPGNLAFLPGTQTYLAALGPQTPLAYDEELFDAPQYVVYDLRGRVVRNTLPRPPPWTEAIDSAAQTGELLRLSVGDDTYDGLALRDEEDGEHVHLVLVPVRGRLDLLAGAARLAGAGLLLLGLLYVGRRLRGGGGLRELIAALRGSFYRKLVAAVLIASVLPLVGLGLFLRGYIERRADAALENTAIRLVAAARRALEDSAAAAGPGEEGFNDNTLHWLRRVVGQEIHVYRDGLLEASSKRELFASGLLSPRLDSEVHRRLVVDGLPFLIVPMAIGARQIPVAYAEVFERDDESDLVAAVPLVFEERQIARAVERVAQMILLATLLLAGLLAVVATSVARTVARPVRELVEATGRISAGDYGTRLSSRTRDEVAALVSGFNNMAASLEAQRADLRRQRDHTEALLHHATTGVISIDPDGRVVKLNPAARRLLAPAHGGLTEGVGLVEALGACAELSPIAAYLREAAGRDHASAEIDLNQEADPRRFRVARVELPDPAGSGTLGSLILLDDVTDLMRSNQLSAWAEMARAIAHEIKNPLTPIQLATEHLRRLLSDRGVLPAPELDSCLDTVIKQVRTLREISGAFSAYAKLPELAPSLSDPVVFMRAAIEPYRSAPPAGVTVEEHYAPCGRVSIDGKVLTRAVVNLVANALDAMPEGGCLRCAAGPHGSDGGLVALTVQDTGGGLDPRARRRLFEPYFSTKSSGTGLGLAIVRRVVEAHRGRIEVDSTPGGGTTFRILLPVVA